MHGESDTIKSMARAILLTKMHGEHDKQERSTFMAWSPGFHRKKDAWKHNSQVWIVEVSSSNLNRRTLKFESQKECSMCSIPVHGTDYITAPTDVKCSTAV